MVQKPSQKISRNSPLKARCSNKLLKAAALSSEGIQDRIAGKTVIPKKLVNNVVT